MDHSRFTSIRRGGALRCYVGAHPNDEDGESCNNPIDIAPLGGRLVVFRSRDLLHAVRSTKLKQTRRYALSIWILGKKNNIQ